ncbi:FAD-binding oxidoreductase [Pleurocapsales cyanobacterium LEGE 06147]|nr:FAD-binding oxidoreductase [Pleurocapsales cyanobacterium LEGE 06147]
MTKVAIIGAGIVGAAIAYELSKVTGLEITLIDRDRPASGSTGAALGVLMGAISHKTKGRAWQLRQRSLERYETLIPELETLTGKQIAVNRQGIVKLLFEGDCLDKWQQLQAIRRDRGWQLSIWERADLRDRCPQIDNDKIIAAVYSPQDRQINPTMLTEALVAGAAQNGVKCQFGVKVQDASTKNDKTDLRYCYQIETTEGNLEIDWLVVAAGLGSTPLTDTLKQSVDIRPVLGQALKLKLDNNLGNPDFQPVITGEDVHLVPLGNGEYWLGATVEFPQEDGQEIIAQSQLLEQVRQKAIAFCPAIAEAKIISTWSGKRPRPQNQPAPIIGLLPGYNNVLLATGHYRNGVLLAPATAEEVKQFVYESLAERLSN